MKNWLYTHFKNGKFQKDGDYLCSSPFREDKHPSFSISPEKRCWHDFGTGESGKLSELCASLGIEEPPREGRGDYSPPPPSRTGPSEAEVLWNSSSPANPKHLYLVRKRLPADGLRQNGKYLLVPCRTLDGRLTGCEKIPPEENANPKRLQVGPKKGAFFFYGSPADGQGIALCEGLATAHSVFQMSGITSATTYSAVFLENGVRLIKAKFPNSEIIVAGDADEEGRKAAEQCRALGCTVVEHAQDAPKGYDWNDAVLEDFDQAREQFRSALKAGRAARIEPEILEVEPEPEQPRERKRFQLFRLGEIELKPPEFLVRGLIEKDSLCCIFGAPESGKSFIALSLAACVSTGLPFFKNHVEEGPIVYVAGEGKAGIIRRAAAWQAFNGVSLAEAPFYLSSAAADFLDDGGLADVVQEVDAVTELEGKTPLLICIDTVSRCFGSGDENATQDMKKFVDSLDFLRLKKPGAVIQAIHHSGVAETSRGRGSSVLRASLDSEFKVAKNGDIITMTATKMKDAGRPKPLYFELEDVPLGETIEGDEYGSAALRIVEEAPRGEKKALSETLHLALQSFHKAAEHAGTLDAEGKFLGVHLDAWRPFYYEASTADNQEAKKVAFQRHRAALVKAGALAVANDVYTLAGDLAEIQGNEYAKKLKKLNRNTEQERNIPEQCSAGEHI